MFTPENRTYEPKNQSFTNNGNLVASCDV